MTKWWIMGVLVFFVICASQCGNDSESTISYKVPYSEGDWKENLDQYQSSWPNKFHIGKEAPWSLIEKWDIDISPDGTGLPPGNGLAKNGQLIYANKCASCHGKNGYEGPYDQLVNTDTTERNTIGNYWPYATTIFDYVRRAMPFNAPGSLTDQEVYDLTAYLLFLNKIITEDYAVNARTLPQVEMPAKSKFVLDDRRGGNEIR